MFFLEKRTKKLLIVSAAASPDRASPNSQEFFGFFQKRTAFCHLPLVGTSGPTVLACLDRFAVGEAPPVCRYRAQPSLTKVRRHDTEDRAISG
jgi:hypothetical protein